MSATVPNLIFPALEFRAPLPPVVQAEVPTEQTAPLPVSSRQARARTLRHTQRERRREWHERQRALAQKPRPPVGQFRFMDLDQVVCHWPVTDEAPFLFCGAAKDETVSYCACHCAAAFYKPEVRRIGA